MDFCLDNYFLNIINKIILINSKTVKQNKLNYTIFNYSDLYLLIYLLNLILILPKKLYKEIKVNL